MSLRLLVSVCTFALLLALPAGAPAFTEGLAVPTVNTFKPERVGVGDVLDLEGANFVPGRWRNQVVFVRPGIRPVFVLADVANESIIRLRVPAKLLAYLNRENGQPVPTRFRISVLSRRLNPQFTTLLESPVIGPPGSGTPVVGAVDCNGDGVLDTPTPEVTGLAVVGLALPGVPAPGEPVPKDTPSVTGLPGIPDLGLPPVGLPDQSTPTPDPKPVCPPPPPPETDDEDDESDSETTVEDTEDEDEDKDDKDKDKQ